MNSDSCDLAKIAQLFVGSLFVVENVVLFVLTVEIYAHDFFVDAHISPSAFFDSNDRFYNSLKVVLSPVSQGKQVMKKLVIGSTVFNLSMILSPRDVDFASCCPTCHKSLHQLDFK